MWEKAKTRKLCHGIVREDEGEQEGGGLVSAKKKVMMTLKAVQMAFQIVVPSVELTLFYPTSKYSQTQLALSVLDYLLVPGSLLALWLLLRQLKPALHPHPHPQPLPLLVHSP